VVVGRVAVVVVVFGVVVGAGAIVLVVVALEVVVDLVVVVVAAVVVLSAVVVFAVVVVVSAVVVGTVVVVVAAVVVFAGVVVGTVASGSGVGASVFPGAVEAGAVAASLVVVVFARGDVVVIPGVVFVVSDVMGAVGDGTDLEVGITSGTVVVGARAVGAGAGAVGAGAGAVVAGAGAVVAGGGPVVLARADGVVVVGADGGPLGLAVVGWRLRVVLLLAVVARCGTVAWCRTGAGGVAPDFAGAGAGALVEPTVVEVTAGVLGGREAPTGEVVLVGRGAARAPVLGGGREMRGGAAWAANAPPTVNAAAPIATCVPVARAWPAKPNLARYGTSATQAIGPIAQRSRPMEIFRNALTMAGSNWPPAPLVSSLRAASDVIAFLYVRFAVITSKASATETIRAPRDISAPDRPNGYPEPSYLSWCCSMARFHAPSQGARGAMRRRPSKGWLRRTSHSSSVGAPGLFRMCGCTATLPTSWSRAAHRSRSRSARERRKSSAIMSVKARTRSE